jgi:hypothetical protein
MIGPENRRASVRPEKPSSQISAGPKIAGQVTRYGFLYFDRSGFAIWAKRLEAGCFVSDWAQVHTRDMDWTGLKLLLEGIEPGRRRKRYQLPPSQNIQT